MFWSRLVALSALALGRAAAQGGADQDEPMLRGGGGARRSSAAMLRFGCSQVVIERLDPCVLHSQDGGLAS